MAFSAVRIANHFLDLARQASNGLTPIQLIKLVYISHGWSLALRDEPLIFESVEAWPYGPVIPELYRNTKVYGRGPVSSRLPDRALVERVRNLETQIDPDTSTFLKAVYDRYAHFDGIQLSNLTHRKDTPWAQVYRQGQQGVQISNEIIAQHYKQLLGK